MGKLIYLMTEGLKNLWRHKMTALTSAFSLFIALYIVGLIATAGNNSQKVLHYLRSKYKIEVFFKQDISNEEAVGLIHKIKKIRGVRTATIIEKEDAVRIFKDQFGEDVTDLLGYNPLPVSAVVNVRRTDQNILRVDNIIKEIQKVGQVEAVKYQGNLIRKIEKNFKRLSNYLPYISSFIILIAVLIIYNTIKLSVYSRKELIRSLQLIGASNIFIKLPFIFEGIFIGILSIFIVFPALVGTVEGANYILSNYTSYGVSLAFDLSIWFWLLSMVIIITFLSSYRAATSFLK